MDSDISISDSSYSDTESSDEDLDSSKRIKLDYSSIMVNVAGDPSDISFAVSDATVAVALYSKQIQLIDTTARTVVGTFDVKDSQNKPITPVFVDYTWNKNDQLMTALDNHSLVIYDVQSGFSKLKTYELESDVGATTMIDGNCYMIHLTNGYVEMYDIRQQDKVFNMNIECDAVSELVSVREKATVLCSMADAGIGSIKLSSRRIYKSEGCNDMINTIATYHDDTKIVSGGEEGFLYLNDWNNIQNYSSIYKPYKQPINAMVPITEKIGIVGYEDGSLRAINFLPNVKVGTVGKQATMVNKMDISSTGELLVTSGHDQNIYFWNVSYFQTLNVTNDKKLEDECNLPSSNYQNKSDFYCDL